MKKGERGISPVVATSLLVAMIIVIALIVFLWFRGTVQEEITKFSGENIKQACDEVELEAEYSDGELSIHNTGDIAVYRMKIKVRSDGGTQTYKLEELGDGWPLYGLNDGSVSVVDVASEMSSGDEVTLIPVLIGRSTESGEQKIYDCSERYGKKITA